MSTVTVSPKYQVVIPKDVREKTHIKKGQKIIVVVKGNVITMVPDVPLSNFKGFAKGMGLDDIREKSDQI